MKKKQFIKNFSKTLFGEKKSFNFGFQKPFSEPAGFHRKFAILAILLTVTAFLGCKNRDSVSDEGVNFDKDASYALGMSIGAEMKGNIEFSGINPNQDEFFKGFKDAFTEKKTRFDIQEAIEILNTAFNAMTEKRHMEAMQIETVFLAENSKRPGIIITSSGLQYEIITETYGEKPKIESVVRVHYEGAFTDGTVFDSSYDRGAPEEFSLNRVIPGWSEGLQLMSAGSQYVFYIPSNIAYGPGGFHDPYSDAQIIPPYATLIFSVELVDIFN